MHLLLTGAPGSGKTTVIRRTAQELPATPAGFYTEEVRERGDRRGRRRERFVTALRLLLDSRSTVVATIASKGSGFIAEAKRRADCELWTLSRANRDAMPDRILAWIRGRKQEIGL